MNTPHVALFRLPKAFATGACLASALLLGSVSAFASPYGGEVACTREPRSAWMSEQRARELFKADDYMLVRLKVSPGNCYEFYAIDRKNHVVEAYMHPITGQVQLNTRIELPPATRP